MKKLVYPVAAVLAALMLIGSFAPAAQARELFAKPSDVLEADWRRSGRTRVRRPPPRPRPRPNYRRDSHSGSNFAGSLIGSAIGGLIAGAIADKDEPDVYYVQPAPPPVIVQPAAPVYIQPAPRPVLVCDQYGNCWYQ